MMMFYPLIVALGADKNSESDYVFPVGRTARVIRVDADLHDRAGAPHSHCLAITDRQAE